MSNAPFCLRCRLRFSLFALVSRRNRKVRPAQAVGTNSAHGLEQLELLRRQGSPTKTSAHAADQIVATGMKDAGYIYVNIDDTWEGKRDANGVLHTNAKFPDMKALADYVHSKGLKLGIYSGPGTKTCADYAGSLGHEEQDAKMYADWGIDYLKYDLCSFIPDVMQKQAPNDKAAQMRLMIAAYDKMGKALKATGRPIVYSLCQYGWDNVVGVGACLGGNLWRTTGDIEARWQSIYDIHQPAGRTRPVRRPRPLERPRHA